MLSKAKVMQDKMREAQEKIKNLDSSKKVKLDKKLEQLFLMRKLLILKKNK